MDNLSTERWTEHKYGNIEYKLRDVERDINEHIPFESLMEELENFIQSIEGSKPFSGFHQFTGEEEFPPELQGFLDDDNNTEDDKDTKGFFDMDDCFARTFDYNENYTLKDLQKIAEYYEISHRKQCKVELVETIVGFEDNSENAELVKQRKKMWFYMKCIKDDKKLRQFLIFDSPIISG